MSGADTDTGVIRVPVHQTTPRMVLKLQHTGLTGVTYFNLTGGEAEVILRAVCAIISVSNTPGTTGKPGKWSRK